MQGALGQSYSKERYMSTVMIFDVLVDMKNKLDHSEAPGEVELTYESSGASISFSRNTDTGAYTLKLNNECGNKLLQEMQEELVVMKKKIFCKAFNIWKNERLKSKSFILLDGHGYPNEDIAQFYSAMNLNFRDFINFILSPFWKKRVNSNDAREHIVILMIELLKGGEKAKQSMLIDFIARFRCIELLKEKYTRLTQESFRYFRVLHEIYYYLIIQLFTSFTSAQLSQKLSRFGGSLGAMGATEAAFLNAMSARLGIARDAAVSRPYSLTA